MVLNYMMNKQTDAEDYAEGGGWGIDVGKIEAYTHIHTLH